MKKKFIVLVTVLTVFLLIGCGNQTSKDEGITVGQTWLPGSLNPTEGGTPWSLTSEGISESVFMLNEEGTLTSRYVNALTQTDDLTWVAEMKDTAKFSDGTPVDAKAFAWALNKVMEENELASATAGKLTFEAEDNKVIIHTQRSTKAMESVLAEWTNIMFKEGEEEDSYIFSGPYMVDKFTSGTELILKPNPHYEEADSREQVTIKSFKDQAAMEAAMEAGELDMAFTVTPEVASQLKDAGITVKTIDAGYQYFAMANLSGTLSDPALRQAINLSLDRSAYQKALDGGELPTGIFAHYYGFAGTSTVTYDVDAAKTRLEEAGYVFDGKTWTLNGEAIKPLNLITYSSRPDLSVIMQIMTSQLTELGFEVNTNIVENIDEELKKGEYDIALYAQHSAPTGNPAYFLNQFFRTDGSKNHMDYSNQQVDQLLDEMGELPLGEDMNEKAIEVQGIVYNDLPVFYLLDPKWHVALSDSLSDYTPYNGDYYIINNQLQKK